MTEVIIQVEDERTGLSLVTLKKAIADNLFYIQGKFPGIATNNDYYMALAYTIRDRLLQYWLNTTSIYLQPEVKIVSYLSAEFLMGPHLGNNLINLDIEPIIRQAVTELGLNLDELIEQESEPGFGNGGLGRLAACYLDSLSNLEIPAIGYGIHYEFGIFQQIIHNGWQVEITDKWLQYGNPWELVRLDAAVFVKLGGYTEAYFDENNQKRSRWIPSRVVKGIPYDTPILGYKVNTANLLRLWKAEAAESFDFQAFNVGDYFGAVDDKITSENISKVLYPNDEPSQGKKLRLTQQYFFVSCSLQDMIQRHLSQGQSLETFDQKFAVQLNDTHPAIAVAELMRLFVDEHHLNWDVAWNITQKTFAYTNHTILPEALEKWSLELFQDLLPRHLEIIYQLNQKFLNQVAIKYPGDRGKLARLSLIEESDDRYVRMANLACLGSHAINGVAALHSELLKDTVLHDFYELWPEKFSNKTNGVTPRRWMVLSNPRLTKLLESKIGDNWIKHLDELRKLEDFVEDSDFRTQWRQVKREIKEDLAKYIQAKNHIVVNPDSLFDVQVKRIHEYKRQHLQVLHIISLYNQIKHNPNLEITPRTFIFGGKAAPSYYMAKLIIKLINSVADVVNNDPVVGDRLKVVFLADYNVKLGQRVYPAADLSEQTSTAGKEASGTGNMKFALNGALTIGTLDGANVEIRKEVGAENFFLFGLTMDEVNALIAKGYNPFDYYNNNPQLKEVIDLISSGCFSQGDRELFKPFVESLLYHDPYLLFADFASYLDVQSQVSQTYQNQELWTRMSILNVARMGKFSSDRAIREYAQDIWNVQSVEIELKDLCPDGQCSLV